MKDSNTITYRFSNDGANKKRPHGRMGPFLNNRNTIWEESIVRYLCIAINAILFEQRWHQGRRDATASTGAQGRRNHARFLNSYFVYAASQAMRRTSEREMPKSANSRLLRAPNSFIVVLYTRRFAWRSAASANAVDTVNIRRSIKVALAAVSVKYVMSCPFGTAS